MNRVNIRIHNSTCTKLLQFFFKIKRTLDRGQRVHLTLLSELCIQTLFRNPVAEFSATHFFLGSVARLVFPPFLNEQHNLR